MLTRDWSIVKRIAPELGLTVRTIEAFLISIPTMNHIEPERLLHCYPHLKPLDLFQVLEIARAKGLVKRSWGVKSPNRCQAQGYWDKLSSIPKILYDTGDNRFRRSDGEYLLIYRHPDDTDPE